METAVEWLVEQLRIQTTIYRQEQIIEIAKEIETQQAKGIWKASEENMRRQFSSSAYKPITFEQWYNSFKELKNE